MPDWITNGEAKPAQSDLLDQLDKLISRATSEWDMTPCEVIGALDTMKYKIHQCVHNQEDEENADD